MARESSFSGDSRSLDFIRACAVLCVYFGHLNDTYFATHGSPGYLAEFTWHLAQIGVLIFFVHTSFVLMLSLERSGARGKKFFFDFYVRRFFRLYPLSMFCTTVLFLASIHSWRWYEYLSGMTLTSNLFYLENIVGVTWTLDLEVEMYLVLPFLFLFARGRTMWALLAVWAAAVIAGIIQPHVSGRLDVVGYSPCFIAGVIAWRISRSAQRILPGWLWPAAFFSAWPLFFIAAQEDNMYYRWAFCLALGLAIPWFMEMQFRRLNTLAHVIAKYSYGIYLSHATIMAVVFGANLSTTAQFLLIAITSVAVPFVMYHTIEHPMIEFGRRFISRRQTSPFDAPKQPIGAAEGTVSPSTPIASDPLTAGARGSGAVG
jgi:peptidoglycan/LPS O-acetylase OafA/YrhL